MQQKVDMDYKNLFFIIILLLSISLNSQTIVESYCVGNNSCSIPATNAVFGDPCGGTYKRLYVKVYYTH